MHDSCSYLLLITALDFEVSNQMDLELSNTSPMDDKIVGMQAPLLWT